MLIHHERIRSCLNGQWWPALLVALALLAGCAHPPGGGSVKLSPVIFPLPPEKARIQYLGSISSPADLPRRRSRFADFVLGTEPPKLAMIKPINAILVGSRLYTCDTILNTILVYDLVSGEAHALAGDGGQGKIKQPNNISVDEGGRFYVADKLRGAVLVYGPDEQFIAAWGRPGEIEPVDAVAGKDALYVADIKNDRIEIWDKATGALRKTLGEQGAALGQFNRPTYLALDSDGNLYITDTFNFRVQKLSPEGMPLLQIGQHGNSLGQFKRPKGMAVDGHGRIYVADALFPNVQIFNAQGRLLLYFGGPGREGANLDLPAGVSIAPWPEQVTWLHRRLIPDFDPEYLLLVVSQSGGGAVNCFAVAHE